MVRGAYNKLTVLICKKCNYSAVLFIIAQHIVEFTIMLLDDLYYISAR